MPSFETKRPSHEHSCHAVMSVTCKSRSELGSIYSGLRRLFWAAASFDRGHGMDPRVKPEDDEAKQSTSPQQRPLPFAAAELAPGVEAVSGGGERDLHL